MFQSKKDNYSIYFTKEFMTFCTHHNNFLNQRTLRPRLPVFIFLSYGYSPLNLNQD